MDEQEFELRQTELVLREREVIAREREVTTKEMEPRPSPWTNPLIISLLVATLALVGNILTNILNNRASAEAEHFRAQSNLVLSVIKTNGNEEDACKNLNFFVNVGWLDDPKSAIQSVCGTKGGVPTLPASSGASGSDTTWISSPPSIIKIKVVDADSHQPIEKAKVELEPQLIIGGATPHSVVTDADGIATMNLAFPSDMFSDMLTVSKDGYEPRGVKPLSQLNSSGLSGSPPFTIELHRVPKH